MHIEGTIYATENGVAWIRRVGHIPAEKLSTVHAGNSLHVSLCLFLIYYFSLCDFLLKFLPLSVSLPLRYLPEVLLDLLFLILWLKWRDRARLFPLFWPLAAVAAVMTLSGLLNSSSILQVALDFRLYFRFVAFTYILWGTPIDLHRIEQFVNGILRLTLLEAGIALAEAVGGPAVREFFAPALGWSSGSPDIVKGLAMKDSGFVSGTFSNYNHFGMFMVMSCLLALMLYLRRRSARSLLLAVISAASVLLSFSRHSLLMLIIGVATMVALRRRFALLSLVTALFLLLSTILVAISYNATAPSALAERLATVVSPKVIRGEPAENMRLYIMLVLPPRFLHAHPLFGQGPLAPTDQISGNTGDDRSVGVPLKAAPDLPGYVTQYLGDVVWVMLLGLYGCFGLAAISSVFIVLAIKANALRRLKLCPEITTLAQISLATVLLVGVSGFFSEEMIARDNIPAFWSLWGLQLSIASSWRSGAASPLSWACFTSTKSSCS